jgi:lipopolysaccharide/colanic/teichoic acid biosynthesis glycosyltransferase
MTVVPVLLDTRPAYFGQDCAATSQLLCPDADSTLISELYRAVRGVTGHAPYVLPTFTPESSYHTLLRERCPAIDSVLDADDFMSLLGRLDPSDVLLLISSACVPDSPLDLRQLLPSTRAETGMVRHLLAFDATTLRTKEFVQTGTDGRVRRIQRYFQPITWPFPIGVIASAVPVACLQMADSIPLDSLMSLRQALTMRGLPSQDLPFHGKCFDLNDERGVLSLNEARLFPKPARTRGANHDPAALVSSATSATVHPSARLLGAVAVHPGAIIEANALIVGPSVIGAGARVCEGATVAQCVVLPEATIAPGATVRHRVIIARTKREPSDTRAAQRRHGSENHRTPTVQQRRVRTPSYLEIKYLVEPVLASLLLLLLSPILLTLGLLVKLTSTGATFYGDLREGKDGQSFRCWKFRTMVTDADDMQRALQKQQAMDGPQFKMDKDPRVTSVGRWLRRLNVDELPQLWNVLRGEMSFVGPRPSPFRENQICVPWRRGRLSVRPGITGLWQVCRHDRALGDFHQWIQYDMLYVRHVSLFVDARIFVYTILTMGGRYPVPLALVIGEEQSKSEVTPRSKVTIAPIVVPIPRYVASASQSPNARFAATPAGMSTVPS